MCVAFQAGGSPRSFGTATNEDAHLIWWYRLGRQSAYLHQFSISSMATGYAKNRHVDHLKGFLVYCTVVAICILFVNCRKRVSFPLLPLALTMAMVPFPYFLRSGIIGVFLHVRCIPHQNSQWLFWASVCNVAYVYILYIYICCIYIYIL